MTLINITLNEAQQEAILKVADEIAAERGTGTPWESMAQSIRIAQEDVWVAETAHPRDACGLCGQDKGSHDQPDHDWQWLRPGE